MPAFYVIGSFLFSLGIILVILACRMFSRHKTAVPTGGFKIYLSTSILMGMLIVCLAVDGKSLPEFLIVALLSAILLWNFISALATFGAPRGWLIIPVGYIVLNLAMIIGFTPGCITTEWLPQAINMALVCMGTTVALGGIAGHLILYSQNAKLKIAVAPIKQLSSLNLFHRRRANPIAIEVVK